MTERGVRAETENFAARFFLRLACMGLLCGVATAQYVGFVPNSSAKTITVVGITEHPQASGGSPTSNAGFASLISNVGGTSGPTRIAVATDSSAAYATTPDNGLWYINALQLTNPSASNINTGTNPANCSNAFCLNTPGGIAIKSGQGGQTAYIANQGDTSVSVVTLSSSSGTFKKNISLVTGSSKTIPEVAASPDSHFAVVSTDSPSSAPVSHVWLIDTSTNTATAILPVSGDAQPFGVVGALSMSSSYTDSNSNPHFLVIAADATNGNVVVADYEIGASTATLMGRVALPSGAVPVGLALDLNSTPPAFDFYVGDSKNKEIETAHIDCSSMPTTACSLSSASTFNSLKAAPTAIALTTDDNLLVAEPSGSAANKTLEDFCLGNAPASCVSLLDEVDLRGGATAFAVAPIADQAQPLCWFDWTNSTNSSNGAGPSPFLPVPVAPTTCTLGSSSPCSLTTNSGYCAASPGASTLPNNNASIAFTLDFDNKACALFGQSPPFNVNPTCQVPSGQSVQFIGGQTVYNQIGVYPVTISGCNGATCGSVSQSQPVISTITLMGPNGVTIPATNPASKALSVTATAPLGETVSYQWYLGTASDTSQPVGLNSLSFPIPSSVVTDTNYWVRVTNAQDPQNDYADSATATVLITPYIVEPISVTPTLPIPYNASASLTVKTQPPAGAGSGLAYKWYQGLTGDISTPVGTNSSSLTTPTLTATTNYWVNVSNIDGSSNSNTSTITVAPQLQIATQPLSQAISPGGTANLSVTPTGGFGTYSYQWYLGSSGVTTTRVGTNSSLFTTPALQATTNYWVQVTDSNSTFVNSSTATITVNSASAPTITTQPASPTIASGQTATLTVAATGTLPLTYQWYQGTSGSTSTKVGSNSASFTTSALTATTSYWVQVSNSVGSANSNTATVTVSSAAPPNITTQPASQTIVSGQTAVLAVVATGAAPLTYQWYQGMTGDASTPVGTNGTSFTTPALTATTNYWVKVSNTAGSSNSNTATVTVLSPPSITVQPASQTITSGQSATLFVTATGSGQLSYQWYQGNSGNTTTTVGGNSSTFTTPALTATTSYWVKVTNSAGSVNSNTATVTVAVAPSITADPANLSITSGQTATLSVSAAGTAPLTYQWYQGTSGNTSAQVGTNSASFTTPALNNTTNFWVKVTNAVGSANSQTVTVTVNPSLVVSPPSQSTITSGQSDTYTISLPQGMQLANPPATLNCDGKSLPTGTVCFFSPAQITVGQSSKLTIATTGLIASAVPNGRTSYFPMLAIVVAGLCTMSGFGRKNTGRLLGMLAATLTLAFLSGCGSSPPRVTTQSGSVTPKGVYQINVIATDAKGTTIASGPATLTVTGP